ncbi:SIMPL domain-containing protein [Nakamurella endophytica]|uniref:DUF541 domain-containing protein n=1 Tax=Nakamurella endophytica TaxID=1748367 RepID=A0A917SSE0_9ACTN|nr:SIMPL domain-containing protein [Nakamurella endophytica]GGL96639.1 hypothetical protein GCM10011594_15460 [Nakamurella endophytica]
MPADDPAAPTGPGRLPADPAGAAPAPVGDPGGVTVSGTGTAATPVDRVTVSFGISETRPDAGEAFRAAAQTATLVLAILADDGADSRSVRTADLTLGPQTQWRGDREELLGYQATQRLIVQMEGLSRIERILSDVAAGGGNGVRIENVSLTASDPRTALAQAREAAVADARERAEHYARLVGRRLGRVRWVDERTGPRAADHGVALSAAAPRAARMPIAGGDATVSASVDVRWDWAD